MHSLPRFNDHKGRPRDDGVLSIVKSMQINSNQIKSSQIKSNQIHSSHLLDLSLVISQIENEIETFFAVLCFALIDFVFQITYD
jgi:hypothetical protein